MNLHEVLKKLGIDHKEVGLPGTMYYNEGEGRWYYVEVNEEGCYDAEQCKNEPSNLILT